ncbi:MAG: HRDC domain-containing protein [Nanoarchaeota archaeon]|nr:HRDC domain-containing protein [Nanoarchaeota archaeon]
MPLKLSSYDKELFNELKELRSELANNLGTVPTYLFNDKTLEHIAHKLPTTESKLLEIEGITEQKVLDFGDDILMLVQEHNMAHEINKNIVKVKPSVMEEDEKFVKKPKVYKKKKYKKTYKKRKY